MESQIHNWVLWFSAISIAAGVVGHIFIYRLLLRIASRTKTAVDELLIKHCYRTAQWAVVVLLLRLFIFHAIAERYKMPASQLFSILMISLFSLLAIKTVYVLQDYVLDRFNIDQKDNLKARKIQTQLNVFKRIVFVIVIFVGFALILMTFERVRQLGTTILASAGVIGIIVGMAAQRTLGTFIAGLQIAVTQPIRIDDVVIVENEWGRIEEITLSYVVVKIWDMRRLIVPITYFIEKPFQNWTRTSADLIGTVFIYVDYTVPLEDIRRQLKVILEKSTYWDKKVCVLQVTNATERTIEVRALVSAESSGLAWDLRCEVREKLIEYIQKNFGDTLPKMRVELEKTAIEKNS